MATPRAFTAAAFTPADGPREARPHQRDSLASRQRTGLPGSRRHRRYLNLAFLTANSGEDDAVLDLEVEQRISPLHQLLSVDSRSAWEPFRSTTEEQERRLLLRLAPEPRPTRQHAHHDQDMSEAWSAFTQLNSSTRQLLREALCNYNYELICQLEATFCQRFMPAQASNPYPDRSNNVDAAAAAGNLCSFLPTSCLPVPVQPKLGDEHLVILLHNSRDRRICHGVAKYYSLLSWSETTSRGQRVTVVVKPKGHQRGSDARVPGVMLSRYLARTRRTDEPGR